MSNPHTKFEVNRLKHFEVIARKLFSDGDTRHLMAIFKMNLPLFFSFFCMAGHKHKICYQYDRFIGHKHFQAIRSALICYLYFYT